MSGRPENTFTKDDIARKAMEISGEIISDGRRLHPHNVILLRNHVTQQITSFTPSNELETLAIHMLQTEIPKILEQINSLNNPAPEDDGEVQDRDAALSAEVTRQRQILLARLQSLQNTPPTNQAEAHELLTLIQGLRQILGIPQNEHVAGCHLQNTPGASRMSDVILHALFWNIPIFNGIIPEIEKKQLLLIDSDINLDADTYPSNAIVVYQNVQSNTPSCADNALLTAIKACALGLKVFLYKQNGHLVAGVYCDIDKYPDYMQLLHDISHYELEHNHAITQQYYSLFAYGPPSSPFLPIRFPDHDDPYNKLPESGNDENPYFSYLLGNSTENVTETYFNNVQ